MINSYTGPISDPNILKNALNDGIKSADFRQAIVWLAGEIRILGDLEEDVHEDEDANTFILELSSLLKELRCPHVHLITGHVSDRLQDEDSRILLLDFLITELMSLKMYIANRPQDTSNIITIVSLNLILIFFLHYKNNFVALLHSMKLQLQLL